MKPCGKVLFFGPMVMRCGLDCGHAGPHATSQPPRDGTKTHTYKILQQATKDSNPGNAPICFESDSDL